MTLTTSVTTAVPVPAPGAEPLPGTLPMQGRTVVIFHAHPDDEAIFTGLTMRRLADLGARIVLVTATLGELGGSLVPLAAGETVARRRVAELEHAAELLGVARIVLLGRRDSGLPGTADNLHPGALAMADRQRIARRLAAVAEHERAEAIVHYDPHGIYGHPDHIAVHDIGRTAATWLGISAYEATVDSDYLHVPTGRVHLIHAAAQATAAPFGIPPERIATVVSATPAELGAKFRAINAHVSQIAPGTLDVARFGDTYGREWFLRAGAPGIVDDVAESRHVVTPHPGAVHHAGAISR